VATEVPRPAFYALAPGGWRDYWTLLHPPYTLWHLSFVVVGAALAPVLSVRDLVVTLIAFFLAVGVGAHALDELHGRPLRTQIPGPVLAALAALSIAGAAAIGVYGAVTVEPLLGLFVVAGVFIVGAYNLELLGGRFHSDLWFGLAWGAFPVLTAYFAQAATVRVEAVLAAGACAALSAAQRALSTPVRRLRREIVRVRGEIELEDGTVATLDAESLRATPERALRWLSLAMPLVAGALLTARLV
jgi:hypothetical protein